MSHLVWLILMAFCGWFTGESVGGERLGAMADILLGITGAMTVRFFLDVLRVHVEDSNALLFSVWGAAALPCLVRFLMKRRDSRASRQASQTCRIARPPATIPPFGTTSSDGHVSTSQDGLVEGVATKGYRRAS